MRTVVQRIVAGELPDERSLIEFVRDRRWFGAKAQEIAHARLVEAAVVRAESPALVLALAEIRFPPGTHELYQLPLGVRPDEEGWREGVIAETSGFAVYDALADPVLSLALAERMRTETDASAREGMVEFRTVGETTPEELPAPRPLTAEQSNTSLVFGDELILKAYRRLEAGINPELEVLRFLTARGFPNIARLAGWYAYRGLMDLTLGILQRFVRGAEDGWELALAELSERPEAFLDRLGRLGQVSGALHAALASDSSDPDFASEEPSGEALALLVATVDEEIEAVFLDLPQDDPALAPIAGRGEEVRERLREISQAGDVGRVIRTHGDYHLGQALSTADGDWIVLDFEGEPARSLPERRRKRSPLRDVAGMLRSFAYAASASELLNGVPAPEGWELEARERFLAGYLATTDRQILPGTTRALERLLTVFELEKAVYELRYELNNRPDWVGIPVAGIERLLEQPL